MGGYLYTIVKVMTRGAIRMVIWVDGVAGVAQASGYLFVGWVVGMVGVVGTQCLIFIFVFGLPTLATARPR